jgi:hypothetical protein
MRLALRTGEGLKGEWIARMTALLADDLAAQTPYLDERQRLTIREIVDAFARDPQEWLRAYLLDRQTDVFAPLPKA